MLRNERWWQTRCSLMQGLDRLIDRRCSPGVVAAIKRAHETRTDGEPLPEGGDRLLRLVVQQHETRQTVERTQQRPLRVLRLQPRPRQQVVLFDPWASAGRIADTDG